MSDPEPAAQTPQPRQSEDDLLTIKLPRAFAEELWANRPPADMWPTLAPSEVVLLNAIKHALDANA